MKVLLIGFVRSIYFMIERRKVTKRLERLILAEEKRCGMKRVLR